MERQILIHAHHWHVRWTTHRFELYPILFSQSIQLLDNTPYTKILNPYDGMFPLLGDLTMLRSCSVLELTLPPNGNMSNPYYLCNHLPVSQSNLYTIMQRPFIPSSRLRVLTMCAA